MKIDYAICPIEELPQVIDVMTKNVDLDVPDIFSSHNSRFPNSKPLNDYIKILKSNLYAYVEYPYVDKLHRDAYYVYYSSLIRHVEKNCIRVSLFNEEITLDFFNKTKINENDNNSSFCGYFIIRPIHPNKIGRSFINPKALKENDFVICKTESQSLVRGLDLKTIGFPHSAQDGPVSSCAEISIWSIMEYFGTRYSYYGNILPSNIIAVLKKASFERQVPTKGLNTHQISYTLRKFGFGTRIYTKETFKKKFKFIINDYVESGIPVLALTKSNTSDSSAHSYLIIGHEKRKKDQKINYSKKPKILKVQYEKVKDEILTKDVFLSDSSEVYDKKEDKKFIIIDDNYPPYKKATLEKPCDYYTDSEIKKSSIVAIVVPLYPKVYLESVSARKLSHLILEDLSIGFKLEQKKIITRLFLTSNRSFKRVINKDSDMSLRERKFIQGAVFPKFIYVCEISNAELYKKDKSFGFIVLDATSSGNDAFEECLLLIFYSDRIIINEKGEFGFYPTDSKEFNLYVNNLK